MSILLLTIPLAILLSGSFLASFFWAAQQGQFDDTTTPALRILNDDDGEEGKNEQP
jgi:cbb3-type cytochrome oxidase maturation protein